MIGSKQSSQLAYNELPYAISSMDQAYTDFHALPVMIMMQTARHTVQVIYLVARRPGHATCAKILSNGNKLHPNCEAAKQAQQRSLI